MKKSRNYLIIGIFIFTFVACKDDKETESYIGSYKNDPGLLLILFSKLSSTPTVYPLSQLTLFEDGSLQIKTCSPQMIQGKWSYLDKVINIAYDTEYCIFPHILESSKKGVWTGQSLCGDKKYMYHFKKRD